MKPLPLFFNTLIIAASLLACTKTDTTSEQEILALETQMAELTRRNDCKAMAAYIERVFADDYLVTTSAGTTHNKSTILVHLISNKEIDPLQANETYKHDDLKVRIYGDAAIVTGKQIWRSHAEAKAGADVHKKCFTHFYVKKDGEWKLAAVQATPISPGLAKR